MIRKRPPCCAHDAGRFRRLAGDGAQGRRWVGGRDVRPPRSAFPSPPVGRTTILHEWAFACGLYSSHETGAGRKAHTHRHTWFRKRCRYRDRRGKHTSFSFVRFVRGGGSMPSTRFLLRYATRELRTGTHTIQSFCIRSSDREPELRAILVMLHLVGVWLSYDKARRGTDDLVVRSHLFPTSEMPGPRGAPPNNWLEAHLDALGSWIVMSSSSTFPSCCGAAPRSSSAPSLCSPAVLCSSGSRPMTFSNCDQSPSTEANSLPTCES
jgi:hypothetical protein